MGLLETHFEWGQSQHIIITIVSTTITINPQAHPSDKVTHEAIDERLGLSRLRVQLRKVAHVLIESALLTSHPALTTNANHAATRSLTHGTTLCSPRVVKRAFDAAHERRQLGEGIVALIPSGVEGGRG